MIKYIGSKRALIASIMAVIRSLEGVSSAIDLFSGTSRVGHALKRAGYRVFANDHNAYAVALARCYIQADREEVLADAERLVAEFNRLPGLPGYFTETFCERSHFFQPKNGERVDAIREAIAAKGLGPELEAVLLVSLMEAADRVDSTTGLQMAYLKTWAPRAHNDIQLRVPDVLPRAAAGKGQAFHLDAELAAAQLHADLAYVDPPYNQHKYLGNYHVWESLILWDKPEVYGIACKRIDCRTRNSDFNSRRQFHDAIRRVVASLNTRYVLVSFNNEGYMPKEDMESLLESKGRVHTVEIDHKRYVGAQIGIYNPSGKRVGAVGHLRNKEYLYLVMPHDSELPNALLKGHPPGQTVLF